MVFSPRMSPGKGGSFMMLSRTCDVIVAESLPVTVYAGVQKVELIVTVEGRYEVL